MFKKLLSKETPKVARWRAVTSACCTPSDVNSPSVQPCYTCWALPTM